MKPVAYMVIGAPHYRQPFIDEAEAMALAVLHGGIVRPLVYEEEAERLVKASAHAALVIQRQAFE